MATELQIRKSSAGLLREKARGTFTEKQKEKHEVPSLSIGSRSLQDCASIQKLTASVQSKDLDMVLKQMLGMMGESPISVSVSTFLMPSSMLIILNKGRAMLSSNNFDSSSSTLQLK